MKQRLNAAGLARVVFAAVALCCAAPESGAADAARGRAIYMSICSSCHGLDGIGNLEYVPSFSKCESLNKDDAVLRNSVRDGIGGRMPAWGVYLSDREIDDAIAFARTFCRRR